MDKSNNPFVDSNVNIRRTANRRTNDYGASPFPLADWADTSYHSYHPPSNTAAPNPHGDVRARLLGFLDSEAAREAAPSSNRPAHLPAYAQRIRDHEIRRLKRAAIHRTAFRSDKPAGTGLSPMENITSASTVVQAAANPKAPIEAVDIGSQRAVEETMQAVKISKVEEGLPDYLDEMNRWMADYMQERNRNHASYNQGNFNQRVPTVPFGFGNNRSQPSPRKITNSAWPYIDRRLMQTSMHDVDAILDVRPHVLQSDSDRRRQKLTATMAMRKRMAKALDVRSEGSP